MIVRSAGLHALSCRSLEMLSRHGILAGACLVHLLDMYAHILLMLKENNFMQFHAVRLSVPCLPSASPQDWIQQVHRQQWTSDGMRPPCREPFLLNNDVCLRLTTHYPSGAVLSIHSTTLNHKGRTVSCRAEVSPLTMSSSSSMNYPICRSTMGRKEL